MPESFDNIPSTEPLGTARLRAPPHERFAATAELFDLEASAGELLAEHGQVHQGHRQKMLYRHGGTSVSLFAFAAGGSMREHQTNGTVLIQVLSGRLRVRAGDTEHELVAGGLLAMSPKVPHEVTAVEESRMLLTVSLASA